LIVSLPLLAPPPKQLFSQNTAADAAGSGGGSGSSDGGNESDSDSDDDEDALEAAAGTADADAAGLVSAEQIGADLRALDEVFAALARVPWLDDGDVDERELRGLVAVGLLGTLEEVGWRLRDGVAAIWKGERDGGALGSALGGAAAGADGEGKGGLSARDLAALEAVLHHTRALEAEYGPPPPASVELAVKAALAGGDGVARQQQAEQTAQQERLDGARRK
jgi:hypothetical protein